MRAFLLSPHSGDVTELDIDPTEERLTSLVGGPPGEHYVVETAFPGHVGYVNSLGIVQRRKLWFFRECHVWGPMVILDEDNKLTTEQVRAVARL